MPLQFIKRTPHSEPEFSGEETALYSKDMLVALKTIALQQRHDRLAKLLEAAAAEAERLAKVPHRLQSAE